MDAVRGGAGAADRGAVRADDHRRRCGGRRRGDDVGGGDHRGVGGDRGRRRRPLRVVLVDGGRRRGRCSVRSARRNSRAATAIATTRSTARTTGTRTPGRTRERAVESSARTPARGVDNRVASVSGGASAPSRCDSALAKSAHRSNRSSGFFANALASTGSSAGKVRPALADHRRRRREVLADDHRRVRVLRTAANPSAGEMRWRPTRTDRHDRPACLPSAARARRRRRCRPSCWWRSAR